MNYRFLVLAFALLCSAVYCSAQIPLNEAAYESTLTRSFYSKTTDSVKCRTGFLLSEYWSYQQDTLKAKSYLSATVRLSKQSPYLRAVGYYFRAGYYFDTNPKKSESLYLIADSLLSKFTTKDAYDIRAKCWRKYGVQKQIEDEVKIFTDVLLNKSIPLAKLAGDNDMVGDDYLAMGIIFKNQQQLDRADTYFQKSIQTLRNANAPPGLLIKAYYTTAENYIFQGKLPLAKSMLDSARKLIPPNIVSQQLIRFYISQGMYYTVVRESVNALKSLDKGISIAKASHLPYDEQSIVFQKFYVYYNQNQFKKALDILLFLADKKEMMSTAFNKLQVYQMLDSTYEKLGRIPQAYYWAKRCGLLKDSINSNKLQSGVSALEVKFRNAENQKRIAELQVEKHKAEIATRNKQFTNWILGSTTAFFALLVVTVWLYFNNKKKLLIQKEINFQQRIKEMEHEQQVQLGLAMLNGEEQERERLARDLHDGLGGTLAGIKIGLSHKINNHQKNNNEINEDLLPVINQLDDSINELRRIAQNMMPLVLLKFGLEQALKDLCSSKESPLMVIHFQAIEIQPDIPQHVQLIIYRIVQELIANIVKHAHASRVIVQCSQNQQIFFLTVEDNGTGFDTSAAYNGMGLNNIKNRIDFLNGKFEILSREKEGTVINIEVNAGSK